MSRKKGRPYGSVQLVRYEEDEINDIQIKIAERQALLHLHNWRLIDFDIKQLLVNVYLQGLHDMSIAIINNPNVIPPKEPPQVDLDFII
jgi:hypothetical protein